LLNLRLRLVFLLAEEVSVLVLVFVCVSFDR
jgi:hypothetical protein